jgi:hypothetical protein
MLFEKVSLDKLYGILKKEGRVAVVNKIIDVLAQSAIEGSEEVATDLANSIADGLINGDFSDYKTDVYLYGEDEALKKYLWNLGEDFVAGGLSGGIMGAGATTIQSINYHNVATKIQGNEEVTNKLYDAAKLEEEGTTARKIADTTTAEDLTTGDIANIMESMEDSHNGDIEKALKERFVELGETEKQANADTNTILEMVQQSSDEVSEQENDNRIAQFEENENLPTAYGELLQGKYDTEAGNALNDAWQEYSRQKSGAADPNTLAEAKKKTGITPVNVMIKNTQTNLQTDTQTNTQTAAQVVGFSKTTGDGSLVRVYNSENGARTESVEEVTFPNEETRKLYFNASNLHDTYAANAAVADYDGESVTLYNLGVTTAYYTGMTGTLSYEQFKANKNNAMIFAGVKESTLREMYELGVNAAKREASVKNMEVASVQQNRSGKIKGDFQGLEDAAELHAKKLGVTIEAKNKMEHNANGSFTASIMKMTLNNDRNMYQTIMHETNEFADVFNPEGMEQVYDSVIDFIASEQGAAYLSQMGRNYLDRYREIKAEENYREALEEFSNDVIGSIFSTEDGIKEYMDWLKEDSGLNAEERKSIIQRIADFFRDLYESIKSYVDNHSLQPGTEKVLNASAEKLHEIRQNVLKVWDEAIENSYAGEEGEVAPDVKFSLSIDEDGIENYTTSEETKNLSYSQRAAQLIKIMEDQFAGKTAKFEKDGKVYLAEYNKSGIWKGVYGDKKSDKKGWKAKINIGADGEYIDLAENALYTGTEDEKSGKNNRFHKDAKSWDYYVKTIKCDGNYFKVLINVKDTGENKYVYDITLKSVKSKEVNSLPGRLRPSTGNSITSSKNIVSQKQENTTASEKNFSLSIDSAGRSLTEEQKKFFADESPLLLTEDGALKRYYHGTARVDRVGTVFDPERATSGPMAFFTDNQEIANNYARDKKDTSLAYDTRYDTYFTQFRTTIKGKEMSVSDAWYKLPAQKRNEILEKAQHITFDEDGEEIVYDEDIDYGRGDWDSYLLRENKNNALRALTESWLETGDLIDREADFSKVLEMAGFDEEVTYYDPEARNEGTYEVYIHAANPFDTSNMSDEMIENIREAAKTAKTKETSNADMWDKNNVTPEKWLEKFEYSLKEGNSNVWTTIPDWVTDTLKENGYDAIVDTGGKKGGTGHQVVIPFASNQIKNIDNESPTENPDIRYSLELDEAWQEIMDEEYEKGVHYSDMPSIIEEGFASLQNVEIDEAAVKSRPGGSTAESA